VRCARLLVAVSGLLLTAGCLTACQTHVGSAAFIGPERISESQLDDYVTPQAQTYTETDSTTGQPTTTNPKSQVLTVLIRDRLFTALFKKLPAGEPSAGAIAAARLTAISQTGGSLEQLTASVTKLGYKSSFVELQLDYEAEVSILLTDLKDPGDGSILVPQLEKLDVPIHVSPRFGEWQASQFAVSNGPAQPSFLTLSGSDTGAAAGTST
jgi:hypothetical protein